MINYTALIILVYNNDTNIKNFIESVEKHNTNPIKYIIIDNGSPNPQITENIRVYLTRRFKEKVQEFNDNFSDEKKTLPLISFITSKINNGFSGGNNKGLRLSYCDDSINNVFVINDDIIFTADIIPKLNKFLDTLSNAGMICPIHHNINDELDLDCLRTRLKPWSLILGFLFKTTENYHFLLKENKELINKEYIEIVPPVGPCILMRKKDIKTLGGYDENVFLYFEEYILSKKYESIKLKTYAIPSCSLIHIGSVSTKKEKKTNIQRIMLNSCLYYLNNYCKLNLIQRITMFTFSNLQRLKFAIKDFINK